jgi:hypothetical protein
MQNDKKSIADEYAEQYAELIRLDIGPVTKQDIIRAFITGFNTGEVHATFNAAIDELETEGDA